MTGRDRLRAFLPLLLDVFAPLVAYWVLHGMFGLGEVLALTLGGLVVASHVAVEAIRRRHASTFTLLVLSMVVLSVVLALVTDDPRFVLVKPAVFSTIVGMWCLVSCLLGQPLCYETAKPFATRGDPRRLAAWDEAWRSTPEFRRALSLLTMVWGVGLLVEARVQVGVVYSLPVNQAVVAARLPGLVGLVLLMVVTRVLVRRLRGPMARQLDQTPTGLTPGN